MKYQKTTIGVFTGSVVAFTGVCLRLGAKALAWPREYIYSGPRESTEWAIREKAYQDIGIILLVFGLAILLAAFVKWLNN